MRKWFSGLAAALALTGCATRPAQVAAPGQPAMWTLSDEDTKIYLFGTFHLLPPGNEWRTAAFDRALASSDELVLEVADIDDRMAAAQSMMKLGVSPNLPPLAERVPAEKKAALAQMVAESGYPAALLDRLETWAAALTLAGVGFKRLGLDPSLGVERTLTAPWKASGKPVSGLETVEEQFGFFDTMSEESQRAFLAAVLETPEDAMKEFRAMLEAWIHGDVAGIARTFDDETMLSPELRQVLMAGRNARWAEWLKARLDRPGTVFVAVGAGHLAGKDSVQAMLAAKGLKTRRVQ